MATSPVPLWAQEMSPYHRGGPTGAGILALAVVAVLLGLVLSATSAARSTEQDGPRWQVAGLRGAAAAPAPRRGQRAELPGGGRACREASGGR